LYALLLRGCLLKRIESGNYYAYFPSAELAPIKKELLKLVNPADIYLIFQYVSVV